MTKNNNINVTAFRQAVLGWYDKHQRSLPWRAASGTQPNPYHVWLSEIMLQQTTVPTVGKYFERFISLWPTIHDLAKADKEDVMHEWAGLGYYARARNLHKCAQIISEKYSGVFPEDETVLKNLPGIGDYTSAAIRAIAYNKPANVVDGNIERIIARIFAVEQPMPEAKKDIKVKAGLLSDWQKNRPGDYAQALMDIGSAICIPKKPKCSLCPLINFCKARDKGIEAGLPKKKPKKPKPQKHGRVYWIVNQKGEVAFQRRSDTLMLGGMLGLPTSEWVENTTEITDLIKNANKSNLEIRHSFTHFDLYLEVFTVDISKNTNHLHGDYIWLSEQDINQGGLPTLFEKVVKLMIKLDKV